MNAAQAQRHGGPPLRQEHIDAAVASVEADLVGLRREIHAHPEPAGGEERTAALVADRLRAAGLAVTTGVGGHGVVGVLQGDRSGRTVGYRADMDAVPQDPRAGVPETAHICGHDVHTAVGVGIAEVLARFRSRLAGELVFVFQPAEEDLTGARAMLDDGLLRRTGIDELHALHCAPLAVGSLAVTPGFGMPGLDWATATFAGPDAAARAEAFAGALLALSTVTFPQTPEDLNQLLVDFQTPDGPLARFVNIQGAQIEQGEGPAKVDTSFRCWPQERSVEIRDAIRSLAADGGGSVELASEPFPALVSPEREGEALQRHLRRVLGADQVARMYAAPPFNGEDFALFARKVPVTYTFLGVHAPGAPVTTAFPHHPDFDPDERAIGVGVRAMAGWLAGRADRHR